MKGVRSAVCAAVLMLPLAGDVGAQGSAKTPAGAGPVLVVETAKGTFQIQTYPAEAPKTVEHIVALAKRNFYNGHRVHRVVSGFVVQFGDPQSRDMTKRDRWGSGGSGRSIGVGEMNPKRRHGLGAVAAAHPGDPRLADSQIYITLAPQPKLDGQFTVFGQVTSGMDVVGKLALNDVIRKVTVKP
ncbi:MAG: peptidylprolyl isomerase [Acidobacteria bacterium]|nr:peptidylprolyl isomerase [Acidobacteriota bacterium]